MGYGEALAVALRLAVPDSREGLMRIMVTARMTIRFMSQVVHLHLL